MLITDPIGDLLTRIRNGLKARKKLVLSPYSHERESLLQVLVDEGYLTSFVVEKDSRGHDVLSVTLKYVAGKGAIQMIKRVSKPGRRVYSPVKRLTPVRNGLGLNILSTSKGVISDARARELSAGGEVLCSVF
jgi:small subunit ribosomal protein S8